jgi:formylglycine-generating enzyme required for sulfatase activity
MSGQRFPWGNVIDQSLANYKSDTGTFPYDFGPTGYNASVATGPTPYTSPMSYFAANGYGLFDMAGNVWAWCWDWYDTTYAGGTDPKGPATGSSHVLRGGSWGDTPDYKRTANRFSTFPEDFDYYVGFRCVLPSGQ